MNWFAEILRNSLPRLLNMYETNPVSPAYGVGDRMYAGWKMQDFANATYQGGIHSLAIAYRLGILDDQDYVRELADGIIRAIPGIMHRNGSLDEAYPGERSFCVTALVAFDVLSALDLLEDLIDRDLRAEYISIVSPLIRYFDKHDEYHAVISNHLATAVAAIAVWNDLTGEKNERFKYFLGRIYENQSAEGWFREYEGADPGYQTLCTYYLAAANVRLRDSELNERLSESIKFLSNFIHPDSSIGGLYGSRNTEVFYPGGLVCLAAGNSQARSIVSHVLNNLERGVHVLPNDIDAGNFIPLLNSFAFAALHNRHKAIEGPSLPFLETGHRIFPDAGMCVHSTERYFTIINFKKGGVFKLFDKESGNLITENAGVVGILNNGKAFSNQAYDNSQDFNNNTIRSSFYLINDAMPTPFKFIVLRSLSITLFRSNWFGKVFKNQIVRLLMTGKRRIDGEVRRAFIFDPEMMQIKETIIRPVKARDLDNEARFRAIHMASSGYHVHRKPEPRLREQELIRFESDVT